MEFGKTIVDAGAVQFALAYRDLYTDQGVCLQALGEIDGKTTELLRFDCFDQAPHYHYGPEKKNEAFQLDKTTAGNALGWALTQLRTRLPDMLRRAGYEEIADKVDTAQMSAKLEEVEALGREMAAKKRSTVTHNRGEPVIEAGNIRFGLEYRHIGATEGMAIHVLSDVAGQEIELLAFDCFKEEAHYHYGPRNKNIRFYWDRTTVPDPLKWTLDQFKGRKLASMIDRAGYPGIVAELDEELIQFQLKEVESTALGMVKAES
jgi:hypothetical protein